MKLFHRVEKNSYIIKLIGNLALNETQEAQDYIVPLISNKEIKNFVINMGQLDIIDSKGIGWLASLLRDLEENEKKLILCDLNKSSLSLLKTLKLDRMIEIYENEEKALSNLF